ncbi:MAG: hypothetical protein ABFD76_15385 [Smithella sp.]
MGKKKDMGVISYYISEVFAFLFGKSWRTSIWGLLAILPQIAKSVQDYLVTEKVPDKWLNLVSVVFAVLFALNAKDKQVTGANGG